MSIRSESGTDGVADGEAGDAAVGRYARRGDVHDEMVERIPISVLVPADSPRTEGEDPRHVHRLAESETPFPPITVHQGTMRVIDGMHRVRASVLRGASHILVRFFSGGEADAFALAVRLNAAHGLPLSRADRVNAARRILLSHPQWSDRTIAAITGLGGKAVGALRRRSSEALPQLNTRTGRDGRVRPLDPAKGRRAAAELITANPGASLREIAQGAGIAVATARDVRERLRLGQDVVPRPGAGGRRRKRADEPTALAPPPPTRPARGLGILKNDPSLRYNEQGRSLLRLLDVSSVGLDLSARLVDSVPAHCVDAVVDAARYFANRWHDLAAELERRHAGVERQRPTG